MVYRGATSDLKARVKEHQQGKVPSTRHRLPVQLIYYEACLEAADAYRRERFLKTGKGKRYLRQRIKAWLAPQSGIRRDKLERH